MSSADSPCAACKFLGRKCTQECVFAPHFPPGEPFKFATIHKIFGASHVEKILNQLSTSQRDVAVASLYCQAKYWLKDSVYGSVGLISTLQCRLEQVETDLYNVRKKLATYIGSSAPMPIAFQLDNDMSHMMRIQDAGPGPSLAGGPPMRFMLRNAQRPNPIQEQQRLLMALREQQGLLRSCWNEQQQQQQVQLHRFDEAGTSRYEEVAGGTTGSGFNQEEPTSLGATSFFHNAYHHRIQHQQEDEEQLEVPFQQLTLSAEGHGEVDHQAIPQHQQQQQYHGFTSHSHQYQHFHNRHHNQQQERSGSEEGWAYDPTYYFERREMF